VAGLRLRQVAESRLVLQLPEQRPGLGQLVLPAGSLLVMLQSLVAQERMHLLAVPHWAEVQELPLERPQAVSVAVRQAQG